MPKDKKQKSSAYRLIAIFAAAALILIGVFVTPPADLTTEGFRALCIMLAAIVLWVTEAIPVIITCLGLFPAFTYLGVMTTREFFAASSSSAIFFTLAGFGIGAALLKTNVSSLLLGAVLKRAKGNSKAIISGFVILTSTISLIVANYAAIIAVVGLGVAVVKAYGDPAPGNSRLAAGIMLAIPYGSMCGGIATPASNGLNVILMDLLLNLTGIEVTFLQWSMVGAPMAVILTIFGAWCLPKIINPETLTEEQIKGFDALYENVPEKLESKDWKFLVIVGAMIVLWIGSNWIPMLDTTRVALLGLIVMFLPGINLITGQEYMKNCAPLGVIMLLCIMPIATAMNQTGAGQWIADTLFSGASNASMVGMLLMVTIAALIIHLAVPSGATNAAICGTLMFSVAVATGIPGTAVALILGAQCGNNFLLAYEGIYAFTYTYGHYTFKDTFKSGLPLSILQYILCVTLVPLLAMLFGLP